MGSQLSFEHVLITTDQTRQMLQELVYSRIAAAWTAKNPHYPVLYSSEAILAIARGLHDAWRRGKLSGDEVARQLSGLFDHDWKELARGHVVTRDGAGTHLVRRSGLGRTRPIQSASA